MHLHYKFRHSVSQGAQRGADFMSRAGLRLRLTRHFLRVWELLHQDPTYLGRTSPCPLVCVPSAATPSISHEIPTFMEVPCDWIMCISSPHHIDHIVPFY